MSVVGHGIDLVEVSRIAGMIQRHGERFLDRCFTAAERRYADHATRQRAQRYAARFACKEAVLKALGTGWRDGIAWIDMEVARHPSGRPELHLSGRCAEIAAGLGIGAWLISLSHTAEYAVASAVAVTAGDA